MRRWLRQRILRVRFVTEGHVCRSELRLLGFKISRKTYNRVGRWLGRKEDNWKSSDGDFGPVR